MFVRSIVFVIFTLFTSAYTLACEDIPSDQSHTYEQLVKRTPNIVLAQATNISPINSELFLITFEVIETLKGFQASSFTLTGYLAKPGEGSNDYDAHNDLTFWAYSNTGNFIRSQNCTVFGHFLPNQRYLIFIDPPHHPRSFEVVRSKDDSWYLEVAKLIGKEEVIANAIDSNTTSNQSQFQ